MRFYSIACCSIKATYCCLCRWLASKGQPEAAEQALRSLRRPDQIEADLAEMQAAAEEESKARSWALLRSPAVRGELQVGQPLRPVVVSILVCHALLVLAALSSQCSSSDSPSLSGQKGILGSMPFGFWYAMHFCLWAAASGSHHAC